VSDGPVITTILPTYRRPALLARAIASVRSQTYRRFRLCVLDNASGDQTRNVVESARAADSRVEYYEQPRNLGAFENFRAGLQQARTPLFHFLSDDDILMPDLYEMAVGELDRHAEALFAVSRVLQVDAQGNLLNLDGWAWSPGLYRPPAGFSQLLRAGHITWTGTVFRREVLDQVGDFDAQAWAVFDLDFALRLTARTAFVVCKRAGATYLSGAREVAIDYIVESWEKMTRNVAADPALPPALRLEAEKVLTQRLVGLVYRTGRAAARQGRSDQAMRAARLLREKYARPGAALLIEAAAAACRGVLPLRSGLGLLLSGYRRIHSQQLRRRLDPAERRLFESSRV